MKRQLYVAAFLALFLVTVPRLALAHHPSDDDGTIQDAQCRVTITSEEGSEPGSVVVAGTAEACSEVDVSVACGGDVIRDTVPVIGNAWMLPDISSMDCSSRDFAVTATCADSPPGCAAEFKAGEDRNYHHPLQGLERLPDGRLPFLDAKRSPSGRAYAIGEGGGQSDENAEEVRFSGVVELQVRQMTAEGRTAKPRVGPNPTLTGQTRRVAASLGGRWCSRERIRGTV